MPPSSGASWASPVDNDDRPTQPPAPITLESVYQLQVKQSEQIAALITIVRGLRNDVARLRGVHPAAESPS